MPIHKHMVQHRQPRGLPPHLVVKYIADQRPSPRARFQMAPKSRSMVDDEGTVELAIIATSSHAHVDERTAGGGGDAMGCEEHWLQAICNVFCLFIE